MNDCRTPGQLVSALLEREGLTQRVLAIALGLSEAAISLIVSDERPMDAKLALALGGLFNVDPQCFLNLQNKYDLAKASYAAPPDPGLAIRAQLFGRLPVGEMIKRGWLKEYDVERAPQNAQKDIQKVEAALARFFGVNNVSEIEFLPHAAKKTNVKSSVTPAQLAWLYRVKQLASVIIPRRPYSSSAVQGSVEKLKSLLVSASETRRVPRILDECGIRYVIVESLPSAKIDGVCFWLNERSPVIGMSLRYDRIDNFWFVLRHELEHVIHQHGRSTVMLDAELEGERAGSGENIEKEERIANRAAEEFCVPKTKMDSFIRRKEPLFTERDILAFSSLHKIHPGLVTGQLQHRTGRYDQFRNHLVKIRSIITQEALFDGWGDVFQAQTF